MYTGPEVPVGKDQKDPSVMYRRIFGRSRPVAIEFMGVWVSYSAIPTDTRGCEGRGMWREFRAGQQTM